MFSRWGFSLFVWCSYQEFFSFLLGMMFMFLGKDIQLVVVSWWGFFFLGKETALVVVQPFIFCFQIDESWSQSCLQPSPALAVLVNTITVFQPVHNQPVDSVLRCHTVTAFSAELDKLWVYSERVIIIHGCEVLQLKNLTETSKVSLTPYHNVVIVWKNLHTTTSLWEMREEDSILKYVF